MGLGSPISPTTTGTTASIRCSGTPSISDALRAGQMVEQGTGGSIVSVSSVSGLASAPYHAPYGAAKAGLMSFTRSLAIELAPSGIRVNCVAPGSIATPASLRASRRATRQEETIRPGSNAAALRSEEWVSPTRSPRSWCSCRRSWRAT